MKTADDQMSNDIELRLLLDGLFHGYGFDFRDYAPGTLKRWIRRRVHAEGVKTISGLQEKVLHDPASLERFLLDLSMVRSDMFADPAFYETVRSTVVPILRTYPSIRIWQPACSTGEEVYSLAILLQEQGLYSRTRIYATDIGRAVFRTAEERGGPLSGMPSSAANYRQAGGTGVFSDYYSIDGDRAVMAPSVRERILFTEHSLATDEGFNEFQMILCRNRLSLFNDWLQERVQALFFHSLCRFGILGIGRLEYPKPASDETRYQEIGSGLYRKISW